MGNEKLTPKIYSVAIVSGSSTITKAAVFVALAITFIIDPVNSPGNYYFYT
jgi:hypothetical protein